jgi:hypothetical protein
MEVPSLASQGCRNTRDKGADQHRQSREDGSLGGSFASCIGCLAGFDVGSLRLRDCRVYSPLSIL